MAIATIRAAHTGTWPVNDQAYGWGSFGSPTSATTTQNIGVTLPYSLKFIGGSVTYTGIGGVGSENNLLFNLYKNQTITTVFNYNAGQTKKILNPSNPPSYNAGDMINCSGRQQNGLPVGDDVISSIVWMGLNIDDISAFPLMVIVGEVSTNTGTVVDRMSLGAAEDNSPVAGDGAFFVTPENSNSELLAIGHSAKVSGGGTPTDDIDIDLIEEIVGVPTVIRTDQISSGSYTFHTVLGAPTVFAPGTRLIGSVQSTTGADVVIMSYWFRLV